MNNINITKKIKKFKKNDLNDLNTHFSKMDN